MSRQTLFRHARSIAGAVLIGTGILMLLPEPGGGIRAMEASARRGWLGSHRGPGRRHPGRLASLCSQSSAVSVGYYLANVDVCVALAVGDDWSGIVIELFCEQCRYRPESFDGRVELIVRHSM